MPDPCCLLPDHRTDFKGRRAAAATASRAAAAAADSRAAAAAAAAEPDEERGHAQGKTTGRTEAAHDV
jgi:hypothetical protein